jgi:DNA-binding transcriptional LysR family regulator
MEIYQLHSFVTVARENHLTRAADILHISQPAVSAHIKALEEEFKQPLFIRTPKGMELTPGGVVLCRKAEKILQDVERLAALGEELHLRPVGNLRIGLNRDSDFLRLPSLYRQLRTHYPGLEIRLHHAVSGTIAKMIQKDELDCGFVLGDYPDNEVRALVLAQLKLRVVGPVGMKKEIMAASQEDLAKLPWIGNPHDCPYSSIMDEFFYKKGLTPKTEVVADQQSAIISMIEAGVGLNFMLEEEAYRAEKQGRLALWPGGVFPIELSFVCHEKGRKSRRIQAITEIIHKVWDDAISAKSKVTNLK